MNLSYLATIFVTVFIAEIGDKTQLAALLFAAKADTSLLGVFLAASAALVLATGLAVLAGGLVQQHLTHIPLKLIAGLRSQASTATGDMAPNRPQTHMAIVQVRISQQRLLAVSQ